MKFVHAADLHLDSPVRLPEGCHRPPIEALDASRRAVANLATLCIDEGVDFLLLAGDTFDASVRDYKAGLFFVRQMLRLREAGIAVISIRGNHDAASWLAPCLLLPDNVIELGLGAAETRAFSRLGVALHGQSYALRNTPDCLAAHYPDPLPGLFNIGLLHTSADGREGHGHYAPCNVRMLRAKRYDYWALGHVHAREVLSRRPWIVFPGNLQGRGPREAGAKGATLVTVEGGMVATVEHRPLDVIRWHLAVVDVSEARSGDEIVERALAALEPALAYGAERFSAVRLVFEDEAGAWGSVRADRARCVNEIRRAALEVAGERVAIEAPLRDQGEGWPVAHRPRSFLPAARNTLR